MALIIDPDSLPPGYTSNNVRKYSSRNPLVQAILRNFFHRLRTLLHQINPPWILDIGCGEGLIGQLLHQDNSRQGCPYVGIDRNRSALQAARRLNPHGTFICMDGARMGFKDGSAPLIMCLEVLEHTQDPGRTLAELARIGARDYLISVPHEPFFRVANFFRGNHVRTWGNHPEHVQQWGFRSFPNMLRPHFSIQILHHPFPWLLAWCRKRQTCP